MIWTDEAIEKLRTLIAARCSLSAIAAQLGTSRNSVAGKAHRLKLHFNSDRPVKKEPKRRQYSEKLIYLKESKPQPAPIVAPVSFSIPFSDLQSGQCRYAVTNALPHLFCGAPTDGECSYCAWHHGICHEPINPSKQKSADRNALFYSRRVA